MCIHGVYVHAQITHPPSYLHTSHPTLVFLTALTTNWSYLFYHEHSHAFICLVQSYIPIAWKSHKHKHTHTDTPHTLMHSCTYTTLSHTHAFTHILTPHTHTLTHSYKVSGCSIGKGVFKLDSQGFFPANWSLSHWQHWSSTWRRLGVKGFNHYSR